MTQEILNGQVDEAPVASLVQADLADLAPEPESKAPRTESPTGAATMAIAAPHNPHRDNKPVTIEQLGEAFEQQFGAEAGVNSDNAYGKIFPVGWMGDKAFCPDALPVDETPFYKGSLPDFDAEFKLPKEQSDMLYNIGRQCRKCWKVNGATMTHCNSCSTKFEGAALEPVRTPAIGMTFLLGAGQKVIQGKGSPAPVSLVWDDKASEKGIGSQTKMEILKWKKKSQMGKKSLKSQFF